MCKLGTFLRTVNRGFTLTLLHRKWNSTISQWRNIIVSCDSYNKLLKSWWLNAKTNGLCYSSRGQEYEIGLSELTSRLLPGLCPFWRLSERIHFLALSSSRGPAQPLDCDPLPSSSCPRRNSHIIITWLCFHFVVTSSLLTLPLCFSLLL